jgi:hypothetical protein
MSRHFKTALPLALALGALAPAGAQAKLDLEQPPQTGRPAQPPPQVVTTSAGFDWGDAAVGAAAGVGFSALAVGGSLVLVGRRRHAPAR